MIESCECEDLGNAAVLAHMLADALGSPSPHWSISNKHV